VRAPTHSSTILIGLALALGAAPAVWAQDRVLAKKGSGEDAPGKTSEAPRKAPPASPDDTGKYTDPKALGMPEESADEAQVTDRAGNQLPLDASFDRSTGEKVRLGDLLRPGKPALLQFVYFRCPNLCTIALDHMVDLLGRMSQRPGEEFDVITISINPQETPNLARPKKDSYLRSLGKPEVAKGWYFLTGSRAQIKSVADAAGFGYSFDTASQEYAHGAAVFVVTPEGKISRTLYGTYQQPKTTWLSLVEAADGRIGSPADRILLYCYHFDSLTGQYTAHVMNIVRASSLVLVLLLGGTIAAFLRQERRQAKNDTSPGGDA
jgi:protein SCO1/2